MSDSVEFLILGASHDPEVYFSRFLAKRIQARLGLMEKEKDGSGSEEKKETNPTADGEEKQDVKQSSILSESAKFLDSLAPAEEKVEKFKLPSSPIDVQINFTVVLEVDYINRLQQLKDKYGGGLYGHSSSRLHVVLRNGQYIGGLKEMKQLAEKEYGFDDAEVGAENVFNRHSREETANLLLASGRKSVYLDISCTGKGKATVPFGRILIELFTDVCPTACDNFFKLCTGEGGTVVNPATGKDVALDYVGCPVHRIVKGGWIQLGDIVDGSGLNSVGFAAGGEGGKVRDETFSVDYGAASGIVGYSSSIPHHNATQFHITLVPCDWMNTKNVGFGRVVAGFEVLRKINEVEIINQKPQVQVFIEACGRYPPSDKQGR